MNGIEISVERLKAIMAREGLKNYQAIADSARERGLSLSVRTIYSMVDGENWSKERLEALCAVLNCAPAEIVAGWSDRHTQVSAPIQKSTAIEMLTV